VKISPKSVKHGLRGFGVFLQRNQNLIKMKKLSIIAALAMVSQIDKWLKEIGY